MQQEMCGTGIIRRRSLWMPFADIDPVWDEFALKLMKKVYGARLPEARSGER